MTPRRMSSLETYKCKVEYVVVQSICVDDLETSIQTQQDEDERDSSEAPKNSQEKRGIAPYSCHEIIHGSLVYGLDVEAKSEENPKAGIYPIHRILDDG